MMKYISPISKLNDKTGNNEIYIKRDDLLPFSFGGNKARKAVKFLEDIKTKKCDAVVTYGSSSSNHCRVIANMAAANNLECYIISPEEGYEETYNSRLVNGFGAKIIKTPLDKVSSTIDETINRLKKIKNPYFIQGGGHGNLGTQAYVDAYFEICEYEKENKIKFDYIFHASGTGTTQAGLVAGKIKNQDTYRKIVGISIARKKPHGRQVVIDSVNEYFADKENYDSDVIFTDEYICDGYASYNDEIRRTIKDILFYDGIALNTTYTGKAFWGMQQYILKNKIENKRILFINTGGEPLFFDGLEDLV